VRISEKDFAAARDAWWSKARSLSREESHDDCLRAALSAMPEPPASELIAVLEERIARFEELESDARLLAEWAATIAMDGTDVKAAARRYLGGGQ
jgi:hypothetical protein